jgi:hypothetical protein
MFCFFQRDRSGTIAVAAVLSLCLALISARATAATPEEVDNALSRAKAFLYFEQNGGLWETHPNQPSQADVDRLSNNVNGGQWGGETALVVYALLASGESPLDSKLTKAIAFLQTADIKGTYALGLRAQLYNFLPPSKQVRLEAVEDVARFENSIVKTGPAEGLWEYLLDNKRDMSRQDHSVSQYGVLGAWACERSGAEVPTAFWQEVENAWIRDQAADGSWTYGPQGGDRGPTASMTVAGVATLFITQDYVHATNGIKCTGNIVNPHIEAGLSWLDKNFEEVFNETRTNSAPYYALYGVERVGVASGRKYLGSVDWYQRGADFLVRNQSPRGGWGNNKIDTCFGMLFLARGRAPVLFNKLQYDSGGKEGDWNERPRDIANLTHWISKQTERDLNWQIVNLKGSATDLLDAPVLYISGNKPLKLTPADEAKLREYCEDGGLIMGNPDCQSSAFTESFLKLGSHMFHDYEFRNLPAKHPIYTGEQYPRTSWKPAPSVLALSNGVRELMLLTNNTDPARRWQTQETGRNLAEYELADNVVLYAIDKKNLIEKGKTFAVTTDSSIQTNRVIKLARLQFAGNWNPEPGGWRRLAAILHNRSRIDLQISVAKLGSNQLGDGKTGANVAVLTGTNTMKLNDAARKEIHDFVDGGGTLILDAAGGDGDFAASVESELAAIFGTDIATQLRTVLPPTAPIYNMTGNQIKDFSYRPFARTVLGTLHTPLINAATVNGRTAIYYSKQDLSAGLVGQPTDGIIGYEPDVATAIMTNLVVSGGLGEKASVSPEGPPVAAPAPAAPDKTHHRRQT